MKVVKNFNLKVFTILTLANIGFYTHLYSQDSTKTLPEKHLNLSVNDEFDKLKLITQKLSDVFLRITSYNVCYTKLLRCQKESLYRLMKL